MMKRMFLNILMFCLVICVNKNVWSQKDTGALTLENLYKNHHFQQRGFGPVRWMKDNKGYSTIERNKQSGLAINGHTAE